MRENAASAPLANSAIPYMPNGGSKRAKKPKGKMGRRKRVLIIAAAAIAAIVLGTAVTAFALYNIGASNLHQEAEDIAAGEGAVMYDEGKTIVYNGKTYTYNENITSIAFIGYDRRADEDNQGQADAVMVAAIDTAKGTVKVIVIPRDSIVDVRIYAGANSDIFTGVENIALCLSFAYGSNDTQSSELTTDLASRVLYNMPIKYYFSLNMNGIGDLADAVGGVYLTPIQTIPGTNIKEGVPITLRGEDAFDYCRERDTSVFASSLDRQAREVQFVKAYFDALMGKLKGDPASIFGILNTVSSYSTTNLGPSEITYLVGTILQNGSPDLEIIPLQGEMKAFEGTDDEAGFYLDQTNVYETVLDVYYTLDEAGTSGNASGGQGGDAASPQPGYESTTFDEGWDKDL